VTFDPYRTLGLTPDASLDEVKRAYRELAKRYHPDRAGDEETSRFLAIQAAYEALVHGRGRVPRGRPRPAWQADPDRARATREAYRARRGRGAGGMTGAGGGARSTGTDPWWRTHPPEGSAASGAGSAERARPGGASDTGRPPGEAPGRAGQTEGRTPSGPPGTPPRGRPRGRGSRPLHRRKTSLTSTSYDEVKDPFEPHWQGSSWYGTSSGTFWTINPREYADPRKHGPEYQARARRAADGGRAGTGADEDRPAEASAQAASAQAASAASPGSDVRDGEGGAWTPGTSADPWAGAEAPRDAARGPAGSTARERAAPWGATADPGPAPHPEQRRASSGAVGAGVLAGGVVAIPSLIVLFGAGPSTSVAVVTVALVLPFLAASGAAGIALLLARGRR
jgi:hypothetical protein